MKARTSPRPKAYTTWMRTFTRASTEETLTMFNKWKSAKIAAEPKILFKLEEFTNEF